MAQYINKDALVAEIDRRIKVLQKNPYENHKTICHLDSLKQSLNTLEVKEVDLEVEISKELSRVWYGECLDLEKFEKSAKHFFELGLKMNQKLKTNKK